MDVPGSKAAVDIDGGGGVGKLSAADEAAATACHGSVRSAEGWIANVQCKAGENGGRTVG